LETDRKLDTNPTKKKPKEVEKFLSTCVKRFNKVESSESVNRMKAIEDLKFKAGDQCWVIYWVVYSALSSCLQAQAWV